MDGHLATAQEGSDDHRHNDPSDRRGGTNEPPRRARSRSGRVRRDLEEIGGEQGDPLHVCTLTHAIADVQDDVHEELVWDQRALAAADLLTDARATQAGVMLRWLACIRRYT